MGTKNRRIQTHILMLQSQALRGQCDCLQHQPWDDLDANGPSWQCTHASALWACLSIGQPVLGGWLRGHSPEHWDWCRPGISRSSRNYQRGSHLVQGDLHYGLWCPEPSWSVLPRHRQHKLPFGQSLPGTGHRCSGSRGEPNLRPGDLEPLNWERNAVGFYLSVLVTNESNQE